ncbi:hypothetical protein TPHA_0K01420 [Tetrapisispora phaffii CBS 4417]|uniref:Hyaluronan/mRNA-binding protein domain-containing protein n=1 Tax=Tetrapisispora phaffii (strain ATCC 24235 / CBS 4417 / NBRC 1672 / NRRL Y-8282 / UCD 70-5) TaxID=1071381 RepID=G8BZE7_TETPH|nr:hypothetical protein TPHA_0K01420 [Tetrapisispora phaffii CBS 4417]CCE65275.1 hypothetical protein TPHA_0K01420 [Tetrapisispora phaffii CBS 4417]
MTRTNKWTVHESKADSKFFTKVGNYGEAPNHVKKNGNGKGNWGKPGDEINDLIDSGEMQPLYNKQRRGSNTQNNERKIKDIQDFSE